MDRESSSRSHPRHSSGLVTGVYTTNRVMNGEDDVTCVFHNSEDGAWQFHGLRESKPEDAIYVCLQQEL
jgi:hypothetical protein